MMDKEREWLVKWTVGLSNYISAAADERRDSDGMLVVGAEYAIDAIRAILLAEPPEVGMAELHGAIWNKRDPYDHRRTCEVVAALLRSRGIRVRESK